MQKRKIKNQVRFYRRSCDLTQEQLGNLVGVHRQTILAIEKQKYEPTIGVVLALSAVLKQPVETLFYVEKD